MNEILLERRFLTNVPNVMRVQLDNTKQNLYICAKLASLKNYSCFETDFWEDFTRLRLSFFLHTYQRNNFYIEDFVYILVICETTSVRSSEGFKISARVRQSSVTSNTMWASVNFLGGQITVQRCVVFVSTVAFRSLYIQELPYMNTFCECILKKIRPTHAHFQYNARKLMSLKSVLP